MGCKADQQLHRHRAGGYRGCTYSLPCVCQIVPAISLLYGWGLLESEYCGHWFGAQILPKMVIINPKNKVNSAIRCQDISF